MRRMVRMLWSALVGTALGLGASVSDARLVVIVSAKSALTALSENEVADIYLGRTSQLSGVREVIPIDLTDDAANRTKFYRLVCGKSPAQLRAYWSRLVFVGGGQPPREVPDTDAMKRLVASGTNAIGYIDSSQLDASVKAVLILN